MIRLLLLLLLAAPLAAHPPLPDVDRILSASEVENYWFHTLRAQALPRRPSALHPQQRRAWERRVAARERQLRQIRAGAFHEEAQLAALRHNLAVHQRRDDPDRAAALRREIQHLEHHRATRRLLEAERQRLVAETTAREREARAAEIEARALERIANRTPCTTPHR